MSKMPERLRHLYDYANSHRTFDLGLLLEAAAYIERLEEDAEETRKYLDECDRINY
jgi:hypothetical protein